MRCLHFYLTAIYTGLRFGEIRRLEWRDVNFNFNHLAVRDPKNNEARYVPMNKVLRETLESMVPGDLKREEKWKDKLTECRTPVFINPATGKPYVNRSVFVRLMTPVASDRGIVDGRYFNGLSLHPLFYIRSGGPRERE